MNAHIVTEPQYQLCVIGIIHIKLCSSRHHVSACRSFVPSQLCICELCHPSNNVTLHIKPLSARKVFGPANAITNTFSET